MTAATPTIPNRIAITTAIAARPRRSRTGRRSTSAAVSASGSVGRALGRVARLRDRLAAVAVVRAHPPASSKYVDSSDPASGAARSPPRPPRSTRTAIAICGFSAGANPMNHECGSPSPPSSAVPDLPAVVMPGDLGARR